VNKKFAVKKTKLAVEMNGDWEFKMMFRPHLIITAAASQAFETGEMSLVANCLWLLVDVSI